MGILVVAEHDNQALRPVTLNVLAAALEIGGDIDLLVAGSDCGVVAEAAASVPGVGRVLCADAPAYGHHLAENMALLVAELGASYDHILAAHTTTGKNFLPRVAALLDVAMISDILGVDASDTFKRPIYAGNGIATVQSRDAKKVVSVRGTGFDPAPAEGGAATIEAVSATHGRRPLRVRGRGAREVRTTGAHRRPRRHLGRTRDAERGQLPAPRGRGGQARRRRWRVPGRGGRGLRPERHAGGADRQDRGARTLHRRWHFRGDTALWRA